MDYYERAGLTPYLEKLGFHLVGYGCTTCIGNSGPLPEEVSAAINENDLAVVVRALRQPELRGPDQPGRQDELPGLAAAGRGVRAGRHDGHRPGHRAARHRLGRQAGLPARHLAEHARDPGRHLLGDRRDRLQHGYSDVFAGDERWQSLPTPTGDTFEWDAESTYVRKPPYFEGMAREPKPVERHRRRPGPGQARRLGDHRPHLAGRRDQARLAGGPLPRRAWGAAARVQLVRLAARQPRGDDPRHLRQHPAAQPARARCRGRVHDQLPDRRADHHLRRGDGLPRGRGAAGGPRRQGVRLRARPGTGRRRAPRCSASRRSSPSRTSGSTGRT